MLKMWKLWVWYENSGLLEAKHGSKRKPSSVLKFYTFSNGLRRGVDVHFSKENI